MIHLLDHRLKYCGKPSAVFSESETGKNQEIEYFDADYNRAAEAWAKNQTTQPTPPPQFEGTPFSDEDDHWAYDGEFITVLIEKKADQKSTERCLKTLKKLKPILQRKLLHREFITIAIMGNRPCVGATQGNTITLPLLPNGVIRADAFSESKTKDKPPITLENLLLHEIGHTLRKHLYDERENLALSIRDEFFSYGPILQEASPHYLGLQFPFLVGEMSLLQEPPPSKEKTEKLTQLTKTLVGEVFAEVVRTYYLEPVLHGKSKPIPPCKGQIMQGILTRIQEEQEVGLKTKTPQPFPLKIPEELNTPQP